jgi:Family of unknown function (DUF5522)
MMPEQLIEGIDYYVEKGFVVFTAHYLRNRGYCCESGCRHCPYGFVRKDSQEGGHTPDPSPKKKAGR